jgi:hypothetical protein
MALQSNRSAFSSSRATNKQRYRIHTQKPIDHHTAIDKHSSNMLDPQVLHKLSCRPEQETRCPACTKAELHLAQVVPRSRLRWTDLISKSSFSIQTVVFAAMCTLCNDVDLQGGVVAYAIRLSDFTVPPSRAGPCLRTTDYKYLKWTQ